MHFSPKSEDLFTIILQVSRFLKEFSDFETKITPEFRHPYIKAKVIQLRLHEEKAQQDAEEAEVKNQSLLAMFKKGKDQDQNKSAKISHRYLEPFADDNVDVSDADDDFEKTKQKTSKKINYLDDIGLLKELLKMHMTETKKTQMLNGHELINVDVKSGRVKFEEYFKDLINKRKIKKNHNVDPTQKDEPDFDIGRKEEESVQYGKKMEMIQIETAKGVMKESPQHIIDQIDLTIEPERPVSFYYYKRWLWMIFPWVCMSVDKVQTFSDLINKCYSSNIRYLSVEEEGLFTRNAINIVIEAKKEKANIMLKREEDSLGAPKIQGKGGKVKLAPMQVQTPAKNLHTRSSVGDVQNVFGKKSGIHSQSAVFINPIHHSSIMSNNKSIAAFDSGSHSNRNQKQGDFQFFTQVNQSDTNLTTAERNHTEESAKQGKVHEILLKSKYFEDRLEFQSYHEDVKKLLKQNEGKEVGGQELNELQDRLMAFTVKEIGLLERKNNGLIKEYNG